MSVLETLKSDNTISNETDSLGGFQVLDSDLYDMKITDAFITTAKSEAIALNVEAKSADGKMLNQQLWMTSGKAKGKKNYYINKKTGDKHYLPGFNIANAISLLTLAKEISVLDTEPGVAEVYGEKVKVERIVELIGQDITFGVIKEVVDKTVKNADTGDYDPTGEVRNQNDIDKVFRARDGLTTVEIRAKLETPEFKNKWLDKWQGEVKDKSTGVAAGGATEGAPKTAPRPAGDAAPSEALFK